MNIAGITDDYEEMFAWWKKESESAGESSAVGFKLFVEVVIQVLQTYPEDLREGLLVAVVGGMDDVYREALDLPRPPAADVERVRTVLAVIGEASRKMPRVPWIRSLQLYPLYWDVNTIGVSDRTPHLPRLGDAENGGHPQHQLPIGSSRSVPTPSLPVFEREEVAKHDNPADAWVIVDGLVYNVTRMLYEHPGGAKAIEPWLGKDASRAFERVGHSTPAIIMMANFVIGRLPERVDGIPLRAEDVAAHARGHGKRRGKDREYRPDAWRETANLLLAAVRQYDESVRSKPKPPDVFPIPLPFDPRPR
jgi:hypothetical protein